MVDHIHDWQFSHRDTTPAFMVIKDTDDSTLLLVLEFVCECGAVKLVLPKEATDE